MIIKPYLIPVLTSIVLAYIFYPVYNLLNKKIKRENLSAAIISVLIILLILIPLSLVIFKVSKETQVSYLLIKQRVFNGRIFDVQCQEGEFYCDAIKDMKSFMTRPTTRYYLEDGVKKITTYIAENTFSFIFSLPKRILDVFITFFIVFFLLKDGKNILNKIKQLAPVNEKNKKKIFAQLQEVTRAIIYGIFVVAVVEGILGAITFKLFGVSSPLLWGIIIFLLALLPMVGAALIWIPAALIKFYDGNIGLGIGITIGGIIISSIDTFVKPKIIGDKAQIHPILVLLGVLGGLSLFSIMGVIIGPLILVLLITFIKLSKE